MAVAPHGTCGLLECDGVRKAARCVSWCRRKGAVVVRVLLWNSHGWCQKEMGQGEKGGVFCVAASRDPSCSLASGDQSDA